MPGGIRFFRLFGLLSVKTIGKILVGQGCDVLLNFEENSGFVLILQIRTADLRRQTLKGNPNQLDLLTVLVVNVIIELPIKCEHFRKGRFSCREYIADLRNVFR